MFLKKKDMQMILIVGGIQIMLHTIETVWADDGGGRGVENSLQNKKSMSKGEDVEKQVRCCLGW